MEKVLSYVDLAVEEGGTVLTGGTQVKLDGEYSEGFYIRPTIIEGLAYDCRTNQEEIFGPVLSVIAYNDEEDAIRIANDTVYGLAGGVWAADKDHAIAIARRMRTGQVEVNGGAFNANAPFGGYKQSGVGREYGDYGFEEFLEIKSMQL